MEDGPVPARDDPEWPSRVLAAYAPPDVCIAPAEYPGPPFVLATPAPMRLREFGTRTPERTFDQEGYYRAGVAAFGGIRTLPTLAPLIQRIVDDTWITRDTAYDLVARVVTDVHPPGSIEELAYALARAVDHVEPRWPLNPLGVFSKVATQIRWDMGDMGAGVVEAYGTFGRDKRTDYCGMYVQVFLQELQPHLPKRPL